METANYAAMKQYQSFNAIEEMNTSIREFLYNYSHEIPKSAVECIKVLSRYACKIIGVAWIKIDTLATILSVSRSTVERALRLLKKHGIIQSIPTFRKGKGGNGCNVYIIKKLHDLKELPSNDVPNEVGKMKGRTSITNLDNSKADSVKLQSETESIKATLSRRINKPNNVNEPSLNDLDNSFTPGNVQNEFIQATKPFLNAIDTFKLWSRVLIAYRKVSLEKPLYEVIDCAISAFKQSVFAKKVGRIKSTFEGYFYTICYANLVVEKRRECKHLLYDFLK
ncbi:hypothetical protein ACFFIX_08260 [Metabacillus herbersteinensis]|uniref:Helix-turn-helix domain-containing protein n=1 Tax=Metabacillus herbersteinensis TaxID=283816 RepID=A0ABV6GDH6_9BACI